MNDTAVVTGMRGMMMIGAGTCTPSKDSKPIALVTVERPILIYLGFTILLSGFLIQLLSIPSPKSLAQMRAEIKAIEREQKLAKKLASLKTNHPPDT
jgi:hypothetical protein